MIDKKKIYGSIAIMGVASMLSPLAVAADGVNENTSPDTAVTNEGTTTDNEKEVDNKTSEKDQESTENKDSTNEKESAKEGDTESSGKPSGEDKKENIESSKEKAPNTTTLPDGKFAVKLSMLNEEEYKCIDQTLTNSMKETLNQNPNQEGNETNKEKPSETNSPATESEPKPTKGAEASQAPDTENKPEEKEKDSESTTAETTEAEQASADTLSVDTYAGEEGGADPKDGKEDSSNTDQSNTPTEKGSDGKEENGNTNSESDKEPSAEENASSNIKVDLTKASNPGVVLNGAQIQDIQIVNPDEGEKVTIEGLPEGLQYNAKSGTITGTPNIELQPNEEEKVFDLKISGTDSAAIKSITIFKDDNKNGIADKDENNDSITLNFELDKETLYISSPTGTKISDVTIDKEGYLVSKGARVKGTDGKEVRIIGEDGKLTSPEVNLPISALFDIEKTTTTPDGTVNDEKVVVDLGCLASLLDVENAGNNSQKPKPNFPASSSNKTNKSKESSEKDNKEESGSSESNGNGAKVINGGSNRKPSGYQNDSEKYTPTLQNLDAGGRLISGGSGPMGPKVDTGGSIETSLLVKLIRLVQDSF